MVEMSLGTRLQVLSFSEFPLLYLLLCRCDIMARRKKLGHLPAIDPAKSRFPGLTLPSSFANEDFK